jgi:hypothetical protein
MLLGSTEWVEAHADELRQHAAVYINTDGNERGYLSVQGSHALQSLMNGVAKDVEDPESKASVFKRQQARVLLQGTPTQRTEARSGGDLAIGPLASGLRRSISDSKEKIPPATTTPSTTTFIGTRISPTMTSSMAVPWRRPRV